MSVIVFVYKENELFDTNKGKIIFFFYIIYRDIQTYHY